MNKNFIIISKYLIKLLKLIIFLPLVIYIFSRTLDINQFEDDINELLNFKI